MSSNGAVFIIPQHQLEEILDRKLDEFLKKVADTKGVQCEKVLSRKEAARFMGESVSTFNEKFKRGEYPTKLRHGNGRVKKYFKSELEAYLKKS